MALAGLLAWLAISATAGAAAPGRTPLLGPGLQAGPVLTGEGVAWAEFSRDGGFSVMTSSAQGTRLVLTEPNRAGPAFTVVPKLAASPSRLAVQGVTVQIVFGGKGDSGELHELRLLSAPLGSPFSQLGATCSYARFDRSNERVIDVSDQVVAHRGPDCEAGGASVRDYATGATQVVARADARDLRIAGRFVAWREGPSDDGNSQSDVVVYDRLRRAEAYRLPAAALPSDPESLDVQEDGTIAVAFTRSFGESEFESGAGWASPAQPWLHRLPLDPRREVQGVRLGGGRIVLVRGADRRRPSLVYGQMLVSGLQGSARVVADFIEPQFELFDFDGRQVAWVRRGCTRGVIETRPVDSARSGRRRSGCPLLFSRSPRMRRGRVRLTLSCRGFARCDSTRVVLRARLRGSGRGRGGPRTIGVGRDRLGRRAFGVRLTPQARAALRRRALVVRVVATVRDLDGRRERRSARVRLARSKQ